jgi:UDP-glucose 4-epimerase
MKILVTGANGLVGSHLIQQPNATFYSATRHAPVGSVAWLPADLAQEFDTAEWPRELGAIVCLAQSNRSRDLPGGAADLVAVNIASVARLMSFALECNPVPHVILASTGDVYGRSTGQLFKEEDAPFQNVAVPGLYPLSRKLSEDYARAFAQTYSIRLSIIRLFHIYGPGMPATALIDRLKTNILEGKTIRLDGEAGLSLTPTYVADLAKAIMRLIESDVEREAIELYNIAGPEVLSLRRIADAIGRQVNRSPVFEVAEAKQPPFIAASTEKFFTHYGEMEFTSFEKGLALSISDG